MLFPIDSQVADPNKTAFQMCGTGECVSFAQLDARANQIAHVLRANGVRPGAHVAILMENNRRFLEACFGMDRSGVYYTTINSRLTVEEIAYILNDCGAEVLVASAYLKNITPLLKPLIAQHVHCFSVSGEVTGMRKWEEAVDNAPSNPIEDPCQGLDMLYSSGTTGRPKGIKWPMDRCPPGEPTMLVKLLAPLFDYGPNSRYLSPAPLYHAAPLRHCMTVIKLGGSVYVMEHFDAKKSLDIIQKYRITHSQWVPTMFVRLLKLDTKDRMQYDVSTLQVAVHAAAPCPIDIKEKMIAWWGPILREYYAGTENNGFCSITSDEWLLHKGSVGRASQGALHICDENGVELECGEIGLVYFSDGPNFYYHNDPQRTNETRNAIGWTTLGDIGRVDKDGYLYLLDRKAFMIISGGVNIYPQEIENVLINHPKVMDVAVIGVPDEELGEVVKAVVQPVVGINVNDNLEEELISYCKQHLALFKCPRSVDFDYELPRHPTGKLYKKLVRDRYWA